MKVLAVDDDEDIRDILFIMLNHLGVSDVSTALSAQEALDLIATDRQPFECFFLDIQMPDVDGIELCREIRAFPHYRETPIFMLTAVTDRSYVERAKSAGATDYLTKPIKVADISGRIQSVKLAKKEPDRAKDLCNIKEHPLANDPDASA